VSISRLRRSTQLLTLLVVNLGLANFLINGVVCPFYYCYGCPAAAFACPIGLLQTHAALGPFPFYAIGSLGVMALALGRFWCGWGCPFGAIQDFVMWIRHRRDYVNIRPFAWSSLIVLAGALIAAWIAVDSLFCKVCPSGSLFGAIPHRFVSPDLTFGTFFYVHIGTLVATVIAFYLVGRFWCRYLCPLGGALGLFNRLSIVNISLDPDKCKSCGKCLKVCPVNIQEVEDIGESNSCIRCGKCVEACPTDALKISASLRRQVTGRGYPLSPGPPRASLVRLIELAGLHRHINDSPDPDAEVGHEEYDPRPDGIEDRQIQAQAQPELPGISPVRVEPGKEG
jgi:ferredoxin-type protein NapH